MVKDKVWYEWFIVNYSYLNFNHWLVHLNENLVIFDLLGSGKCELEYFLPPSYLPFSLYIGQIPGLRYPGRCSRKCARPVIIWGVSEIAESHSDRPKDHSSASSRTVGNYLWRSPSFSLLALLRAKCNNTRFREPDSFFAPRVVSDCASCVVCGVKTGASSGSGKMIPESFNDLWDTLVLGMFKSQQFQGRQHLNFFLNIGYWPMLEKASAHFRISMRAFSRTCKQSLSTCLVSLFE